MRKSWIATECMNCSHGDLYGYGKQHSPTEPLLIR